MGLFLSSSSPHGLSDFEDNAVLPLDTFTTTLLPFGIAPILHLLSRHSLFDWPVLVWIRKLSYSLFLWQQLFCYRSPSAMMSRSPYNVLAFVIPAVGRDAQSRAVTVILPATRSVNRMVRGRKPIGWRGMLRKWLHSIAQTLGLWPSVCRSLGVPLAKDGEVNRRMRS